MAAPDKVFLQAYAWYQNSIDRLLALSAIPAAQQPAVEQLIWQLLGVLNASAPPANPDLADFRDNGAAPESMAVACEVVGEVLAALGHVKQALDALNSGSNPAAALAVVGPVMAQIDRLVSLQPNARYPSAFSVGKMLLMLSGDAESNPSAGHEADRLAALLGAISANDIADRQAALGIVTLLVGSMLDRSFTAPSNAAVGFVQQALPSFAGLPTLTLPGPPGFTGTLAFDVGPPSAMKATLALAQLRTQALGGTDITLAVNAKSGVDVVVPVLPPGAVQVNDGGYSIGVEIKRSGNALTIGSDAQRREARSQRTRYRAGLTNGKAALQFFARGTKATIKPSGRLPEDDPRRGTSVSAWTSPRRPTRREVAARQRHGAACQPAGADAAHRPVRAAVDPPRARSEGGQFPKLAVEVSASFGVTLGPFAASVDRLGMILKLNLGGANPIAFAFKPPNGIGLVARRRYREGRRLSRRRPEWLRGRAGIEAAGGRREGDRTAEHAFGRRLLAAAADLRAVPADPAVVRLHAHRHRRPHRRAAHGQPAGAVAGAERRPARRRAVPRQPGGERAAAHQHAARDVPGQGRRFRHRPDARTRLGHAQPRDGAARAAGGGEPVHAARPGHRRAAAAGFGRHRAAVPAARLRRHASSSIRCASPSMPS